MGANQTTRLRDQFAVNGFCLSEPLVDERLLTDALAAVDEVLAGRYETGIAPIYRSCAPGDARPSLVKVDLPHLCNRTIHRLVSHPAIGAWAAAVLDAGFVQLWACELIYKAPAGGQGGPGVIGWHQGTTASGATGMVMCSRCGWRSSTWTNGWARSGTSPARTPGEHKTRPDSSFTLTCPNSGSSLASPMARPGTRCPPSCPLAPPRCITGSRCTPASRIAAPRRASASRCTCGPNGRGWCPRRSRRSTVPICSTRTLARSCSEPASGMRRWEGEARGTWVRGRGTPGRRLPQQLDCAGR